MTDSPGDSPPPAPPVLLFPPPEGGDKTGRERKRRRLVLALTLTVVAVGGGIAYNVYAARREREFQQEWTTKRADLPPRGGKFFKEKVLIGVPLFLQNDPRWGNDPLGPSATDTLGSAGCAVSSCAMVLAAYGLDTDPQRLNDFLTGNGGFTPQAWLEWTAAVKLAPERVQFIYEDLPSFELIDTNLEKGNPVIVRLRYPSRVTHFVVICGKEGYDYLVRDPAAKGAAGVYPLHEFGSNIEALRYYEPLHPVLSSHTVP